jgi:molybdenum cofactor synthesis domain-containing protein
MIPLAEARERVLASLPAPEVVEMSVSGALGLVLAADVRSPSTVPPFDNSAMDGYAVRFEDLSRVPCVLAVSEDVAAGHVAEGAVERGTAIKIMTGAPLPAGADTIVRVEDTVPGEGSVEILVRPDLGTAVRREGGDVAAGDLVFGSGDVLSARHAGVLAAVGIERVQVYRPVRVAVVSTGDEVVPPSTQSLAPGQIRDSNRPLLVALLAEMGLEAIDYGIVGDDAGALRDTFARAAAECDAVITSGGVSMGEYDLVKRVLTELGGVEIWKVAMQPAKPFAFGAIGGVPVFGLPGNPVSVFVAFEQFARPAILSMMGHTSLLRPKIEARLAEDVSTDPEKTVFLRVETEVGPTGRIARLAGGQASNVLSATARADAFAVVPRGVSDMSKGDSVELEMFRWSNE